MSSSKEFWIPVVGADWYNNCKGLFDSSYMAKLLSFIQQENKVGIVYPKQKDIFKAFKLTNFEDVRVVIIGQDPYFTESNGIPDATGLAFANPIEKLNPNSSLEMIWKCIERSCYNGVRLDFDYTLEEWAEQGVLLLNTALTVKKYSAGSHTKPWDNFTKYILQCLNAKKTGLHFCFWGNHAKEYNYHINDKKHFKYEFTHPAYAARQGIDWGCPHFKDINVKIAEQNGEEFCIRW